MSIRFFKKKLKEKNNEVESIHDYYIRKKNIKMGRNTSYQKATFQILGSIDNQLNIEIGEDSIIEGTIILYNPMGKVVIGDRVYIGHTSTIFCYKEIVIRDDVMISWGCTLIDTNAHSLISSERSTDVLDWKKGWNFKDWSNVKSGEIFIGEKSWIGFNTIILKNVKLERGCVVGAGSIVTKDFREFSVIAGNPAHLVKTTA
jgi:acetyltransferase-like isoleucine patch superfamily enzyme